MRQPKPYPPIDLARLETFPISERTHKVRLADLARPAGADATLGEFVASLPTTPVTDGLRALAAAVADAVRADAPVVAAFGGHVVKCGLGPILIDLMERGIVTAVATHGAGAIHDVELAFHGETSEDPAQTMRDGRFGMVHETPGYLNDAARLGRHRGLGQAVGDLMNEDPQEFPHADRSVLAAAARLGCTATVHVAIGTDTVHMHPEAAGADIGEATLIDFRKLCAVVADMARGVWLNLGSAVVLPEVFMKAYTVAANLGASLDGMTTANLDQIQHYRPRQNVLCRPTERGVALTGHHEIMVPLLRHLVLTELETE
ncbi:MAG: hypothetical protein R6X20_16765 [Phycisphaerae bacterium]